MSSKEGGEMREAVTHHTKDHGYARHRDVDYRCCHDAQSRWPESSSRVAGKTRINSKVDIRITLRN